MKIENRVEALEHELKILKNEIQSTLLEIREQVLNHYYPELRASEPGPSKAPKVREARPSKSLPTAPVKKVQVSPFSDISLDDLDLDDEDLDDFAGTALDLDEQDDDDLDNDDLDGELDDAAEDEAPALRAKAVALPKTKEVRLNQLKAAPAKAKPGSVRQSEPEPQKPNRRTFAALAAWVGDAVAKVGKERTIQVIETYSASGGSLSKETKSSLLQLASLASDEQPATPAGNQEMLNLMVELDQIFEGQQG